MAGLLDVPQLPGLLPIANWDDLAQRVPPGVGNALWWQLPVAPPVAGAAPAPMTPLSLPDRSPVAPPHAFAGPPFANWVPSLPPAAPARGQAFAGNAAWRSLSENVGPATGGLFGVGSPEPAADPRRLSVGFFPRSISDDFYKDNNPLSSDLYDEVAGRRESSQYNAAKREIEKYVGRPVTPREWREFHDKVITGQGYGYHEIIEEGKNHFSPQRGAGGAGGGGGPGSGGAAPPAGPPARGRSAAPPVRPPAGGGLFRRLLPPWLDPWMIY